MELESLVQLFEGIPPARGSLWTVSEVFQGRLYLTKSEDGLPALFLEGEKDSFGALPQIDAIRHSDDIEVIPEGRIIRALRIKATNALNGGRVIAHIAYEIAWRLAHAPQPTNEELVSDVSWLLALFGERSVPIGSERQKGLVGECLFLRLLLKRALERGVRPLTAIECWAGADLAKRDFYARKVAVEAKTTSNSSRLHHITSLDQLAPQEQDERVYLFSVGIRQDPTAPRKITHFVADVEALLVDRFGKADLDALSLFRENLKKCGFDWADSELYERDAGFLAPHLMPALFEEATLRRLSLTDFVDQQLPETVRSLSYLLEVVANPISEEELQSIYDRLLGLS